MHDVLACPPKRLDVACGMRWTVPKQEFAQPDVPQCRINIVGVNITGLTREMLPKPQKFRHRAPPTHLAPVAQKSADGRRAAVVAFQVVPPARRTVIRNLVLRSSPVRRQTISAYRRPFIIAKNLHA